MCGIAGFVGKDGLVVPSAPSSLDAMGQLIAHRGPDGSGTWLRSNHAAGLTHRRLSIIDLSDSAAQPMRARNETVITFNGEIYNYKELRSHLASSWVFRSQSDTECILAAYDRYGDDCVSHLRGMFAFALWDESRRRLFCARDRFGIKPFYYCDSDGVFYFASEAKALLPFLPQIVTDSAALAEYLTFQYTIGEKTLFDGVRQLLPAHTLVVERGEVVTRRYWDVRYEIDFDHSSTYFRERLRGLLDESIELHLRSDVPVGCYVSGGVDSSLLHILANRQGAHPRGFHGRFTDHPGYDESAHALAASAACGGSLDIADISADDFRRNIGGVIYHLDFPVAGPGAFPQYMVSKLAGSHVKVVLGGQGGDEIFGGYARYLLAYLEQCLSAAIDGTYKNGNYVVTIESIIPNLGLLREYKPMMREFWREGLFDSLDARYFRLIDRSSDMQGEVRWGALDKARVYQDFLAIFNNTANVKKEAYFDRMTHFDFKCLLPALLQVEDRMSMAHGLESRVPLLDHPLVEFVATVPADVKFSSGALKHLLKTAIGRDLPRSIVERRDKMGFPVPLKEWFGGPLKGFIEGLLDDMATKGRPYLDGKAARESYQQDVRFSRKTWGLVSLELWHQRFHDRAAEFRSMAQPVGTRPASISTENLQ